MGLLSREDIFAAKDIAQEQVDMTEFSWPGYVNVRGMTGKQRGKFEADLQTDKGKTQKENWVRFRAKMLVYTVVDDEGKRLFSEADIEALNEKSAAALDHLFNVAQQLSGYRKEDVDDMTKNLQSDQNEDSSSD